MKLEQQVCNLELAKRLKKLGVKQESLWIWAYGKICWYKENEPNSYSAFTVAELGEMLKCRGIYFNQCINPRAKSWVIIDKEKATILSDIDEADARAKMLIHLIENKLIKC